MTKKGENVRLYTKADLDKIRAEYPTFKPVEELAEELGRTVNALHLKAMRMGVMRPYSNRDPETRQKTRCFGLDFDETCIGKCPQWVACLEEYTDKIKNKLEIEYKEKRLNKIRVKNKVLASQIIEVIKEINKSG